MTTKVYQYAKCSTCRKALKFLDARKVAYQALPIVEQPPTKRELETMLKHVGGDIRKLFNTSGVLYREMNIKERLGKMSTDEALDLLAREGKLVKRPFVLKGTQGTVGFNEDAWSELFG